MSFLVGSILVHMFVQMSRVSAYSIACNKLCNETSAFTNWMRNFRRRLQGLCLAFSLLLVDCLRSSLRPLSCAQDFMVESGKVWFARKVKTGSYNLLPNFRTEETINQTNIQTLSNQNLKLQTATMISKRIDRMRIQ